MCWSNSNIEKMKCVIPAKHIRMLGRVIHTLARIGDYLFIEPLPNNNLALRTLNSSRSSFLSFILNENFFEEYIEKMPDDTQWVKIPKKFHFGRTKTIFFIFWKVQKSIFLTFSKVQKHIFCYFKNGKKSIFAPKKG